MLWKHLPLGSPEDDWGQIANTIETIVNEMFAEDGTRDSTFDEKKIKIVIISLLGNFILAVTLFFAYFFWKRKCETVEELRGAACHSNTSRP
ncbi:hypothetical protein AMTR_s00109p00111130 [Amborella trichopoda]|uniref:Uncharacterized protein n=1 Tax=Amborella trichopoda TaxID=13333 RepID=W1NS06_AMBTC|nr:hypothetical protein AMTR_s00109p00111130 [Amborella trichopoda]